MVLKYFFQKKYLRETIILISCAADIWQHFGLNIVNEVRIVPFGPIYFIACF